MLDQYFFMLRKAFPQPAEEELFAVTLSELAGLFHCTGRNVNLILRKMEELDWIEWCPGRGRGNRSQLAFRIPLEELVMQTARELVQKGDIREAFRRLDEYAHIPFLKEKFMQWLDTHFGYRPEIKRRQTIDTLRLPYGKPVHCLDPIGMVYAVESHLIRHLFDTLVRFDSKSGEVRPHLAHFWESDGAGTEWTFYLRKGVLFHHGRELTAHDAKFSFERLKAQSPYRWMFESMTAVEVVTPYVLRIRLSEPNFMFLHYLAFCPSSVVPADVVQEFGEQFKNKPVGSGPFHLLQNDENMLIMEAFPRYFDKRAHLDRIEIWITSETDADRSYESESADQPHYSLHYSCYAPIRSNREGWKSVVGMARGTRFLMFNLAKDGPQHDIRLRRAVQCSLRRDELPLYVDTQDLEDASSFVPKRGLEPHSYEPERARRLLAESGYANETLRIATTKDMESIRWLIDQLGRIGIRSEGKPLSSSDGQFPFEEIARADIFIGEVCLEEDVDLSLMELFLSENSGIRFFLSPELLEKARQIARNVCREPSPARRTVKVQELERMFRTEAAGIMLFHRMHKTVYHPSLKGVSLTSLGWISFQDTWFEQISDGSTAEPAQLSTTAI